MGACRAPDGGRSTGGHCDGACRGHRAADHSAQSPLPSLQRRGRHRGDDATADRAGRPGETRKGRSTVDRLGREAAMSYEWGRAPEAGKWQRAIPGRFMSVVLVALVSGIGMCWVRQALVWTPLQRFYLSAYVRSALASSLAIQTGRYRLLLMESRRGSRLAIDEEVVPVSTSS